MTKLVDDLLDKGNDRGGPEHESRFQKATRKRLEAEAKATPAAKGRKLAQSDPEHAKLSQWHQGIIGNLTAGNVPPVGTRDAVREAFRARLHQESELMGDVYANASRHK